MTDTENLTPFEMAGYTKDTKFKVINNKNNNFKVGDIVRLCSDDTSVFPYFTDGISTDCLYLPTEKNSLGYYELEVFTEEQEIKDTLGGNLSSSIAPAQFAISNLITHYTIKAGHYHLNTTKAVNTCTEESVVAPTTNLSLAARIIVSQSESYNGHSQLTVTYTPRLEELTNLLKELYNYYTKINHKWSVYATIEGDGSGSIHVREYWDEENPPKVVGHKDKLLFSFGEK